ncbi:HBL/NHE enterotoxin family protein [Chengkuizengella sp. SCS-71B]|uniref:HBL/NHE enterotoxin family protein n=1 Tax=Chengkuizengella sp. SCS-71B TaxID=3115290 RepID=UPI0032C213B8
MNKFIKKGLSIVFVIMFSLGLFSSNVTVYAINNGISSSAEEITITDPVLDYVEYITHVGLPSWITHIPNIIIHLDTAGNRAKFWKNEIHPDALRIINNTIDYNEDFNSAYDLLIDYSERMDEPGVRTSFISELNKLQNSFSSRSTSVADEHRIINNFKKQLRDVDQVNFQNDYKIAYEKNIKEAMEELGEIVNLINGAITFLDQGFSGLENQWFSLSLKFDRLIEIVVEDVDVDSPFLIGYLNDIKSTWDDTFELALTIQDKMDHSFKRKVIGCSIPWKSQNLPPGEKTYYTIYDGKPAAGGRELGKFEGTHSAITLSSALYDILEVKNPDQTLYTVKEVNVNGELLKSDAYSIPSIWTLSEAAFLFSEKDFQGDCIVQFNYWGSSDLNEADFDNKLSSMLVRGNVYVRLWQDANYRGFGQAFFTEDSFTQIRNFGGKVVGANAVSSILIEQQKEGVYFFKEEDFSGTGLSTFISTNPGITHYNSKWNWMNNNSLSSVKVVGPYALIVYDLDNFTGGGAIIKENYGGPNLSSDHMNNRTESFSIFKGEGVWFFEESYAAGNWQVYPQVAGTSSDCRYMNDCAAQDLYGNGVKGAPMLGDTLSSVLVIGDYSVTLYEHPDYKGNFENVEHFSIWLTKVGDNKTSSFKIYKK